jgi:hypothetical protein
MDSAENNDIGPGLFGPVAQTQGVADVICQVLNFGNLVVMRQNDRVPLFLKPAHFFGQVVPLFESHHLWGNIISR